jgi:hypothetical protein
MQLSNEFKQKVKEAILKARENYGGSDSDFAKSIGVNGSVYSQLKGGKIDKLLSDSNWITIGRMLNISTREDAWKVAKTTVYEEIEKNLEFCQQHSKSMMLVDVCGIGKTFCAKHIVRKLRNAFYFDCSQAKTKQQFIRQLAKTVGSNNQGKYIDVKNELKYCLTVLETPLIVLDEAGDLEYTAFLELKELWNATTGACGWYMMGADGLAAKVKRGIEGKKVGYAEIFSRFSDEFVNLVPIGTQDKKAYLSQLITDVALVNLKDKSKINNLVKKCLDKEATLRYLETVIKVNAA